jgi:acylphosphatase
VKNLPDGTVEAYAEGDEDPMEQFLSRIRKGPSLGLVQNVEVGEAESEGYQDFSIEW